MPKITLEEFETMLAKGVKFFYTIDTSIFISNNFRFDGDQLSGFCIGSKNAQFVIPKIIYAEVLKSYVDFLNDAQKKSTEALKRFPASEGVDAYLTHLKSINIKEVCTIALESFLINKELSIVDNNVDINEILDSYFTSKPPFGDNQKKKNEFPDAIAISTLERHAKMNRAKLVIISNDPDWTNFCDLSPSTFYIENTKEILKRLRFSLKKLQEDETLVDKFKHNIIENKYSDDLSTIEDAIAVFFEDTSTIECEATSSFALDMDIEVESISVDHINYDESKWVIEDKKPDSITLIGLIPTEITCTASIDFSKWDSEDQENYGISCISKEQTESLLIEVRVNLSTEELGDLSAATIDDCTVTSKNFYINLGDVYPFEDEE